MLPFLLTQEAECVLKLKDVHRLVTYLLVFTKDDRIELADVVRSC